MAELDGCCSTCDGTGASYDESTGGKCSDCYGTGHAHLGPCDFGVIEIPPLDFEGMEPARAPITSNPNPRKPRVT